MTCRVRHAALLTALLAGVVLTGCDRERAGSPDGTAGGSSAPSGGGGGTTASFSIGGTITGLTAAGLALSTGNNMLTVTSGATSFVLPTLVSTGASYSVQVTSQPMGLTCLIADGNGTVGKASVSNVQVTCSISTYTVGGTVTGLNASGLILADAADAVPLSTGTSAFLLPTRVAAGSQYAVTVSVQPTGLSCQVVNGTGVMPFAAVTDVMIQCGQWSWISGAESIGAAGSYGAQGTAALGNVPGARSGAVSWTDHSGTLWLFGGAGSNGDFNDLWKYTPGNGEWTWVSGSQSVNAAGVYGVQGTAAVGNAPGARTDATSWVDSAGNFWLFGGDGHDSVGTDGSLGDLWEYDPGAGQWTWKSGSDTASIAGVAPSIGAPGARTGAASWSDGAGNLWLFGGMGTQGLTDDLWEYVPGMNQWTLVSGSQTANALGVYGKEGSAAAGNVPGSRMQAVTSIDAAGTLWLFGGSGYGAIGNSGLLNDLWKFNPTTSQWTWVSGWATVNAAGVYGTRSTTDPRQPGARAAAAAATDMAGNLWLFGGTGYDSTGTRGVLNDTWEYSVSGAQWIWMGGSQSGGTTGTYGTEGIAAAGNAPGARSTAVAWMDGSGDFWLFGGQGFGAATTAGGLNDLWEFVP